jgi:hypothetical protein
MTLTEVQARVTKTASFVGSSVDVSGMTGDWTLKLQVEALSDSTAVNVPTVRFGFEDAVLADFTGALTGPTIDFKGTLAKSYDKVKSFKKQDFPGLRIGVTSGILRLKLLELSAYASGAVIPTTTTTGTCTYRAWVESA